MKVKSLGTATLLSLLLLLGACDSGRFSSASETDQVQAAENSDTEVAFPPNDLWKQDLFATDASVENVTSVNGIDEALFGRIIDSAAKVYQYEASQRNEKIEIEKLWQEPRVSANVSRKQAGIVRVKMFGGLARRLEILPESLVLVVCHELGHAYAGAPYVNPSTQMAAEGMADYYATRNCFARVYWDLPELRRDEGEVEPFLKTHCYFNDPVCRTGLRGAKGLATLLSNIRHEANPPAFETPDPTVVPQTLLSYPKTAQCRLDTYVAGVFYQPKPACWWKSAQ